VHSLKFLCGFRVCTLGRASGIQNIEKWTSTLQRELRVLERGPRFRHRVAAGIQDLLVPGQRIYGYGGATNYPSSRRNVPPPAPLRETAAAVNHVIIFTDVAGPDANCFSLHSDGESNSSCFARRWAEALPHHPTSSPAYDIAPFNNKPCVCASFTAFVVSCLLVPVIPPGIHI
jgi:hypothetical protein